MENAKYSIAHCGMVLCSKLSYTQCRNELIKMEKDGMLNTYNGSEVMQRFLKNNTNVEILNDCKLDGEKGNIVITQSK